MAAVKITATNQAQKTRQADNGDRISWFWVLLLAVLAVCSFVVPMMSSVADRS